MAEKVCECSRQSWIWESERSILETQDFKTFCSIGKHTDFRRTHAISMGGLYWFPSLKKSRILLGASLSTSETALLEWIMKVIRSPTDFERHHHFMDCVSILHEMRKWGQLPDCRFNVTTQPSTTVLHSCTGLYALEQKTRSQANKTLSPLSWFLAGTLSQY